MQTCRYISGVGELVDGQDDRVLIECDQQGQTSTLIGITRVVCEEHNQIEKEAINYMLETGFFQRIRSQALLG